jgi:16S rRNA (guanine(966)-N(2))-methyltransferase RsmD
MRVIGGTERGRALRAPPRPRTPGRAEVRPTSDLVRGVIFDMLGALGADYSRVLDLYAGTGALGIEALSRGDGTAEFVETDSAAITLLTQNLASTRMAERGRIHRLPAERAATSLSGVFTLVLADPPYYDVDAFAAVSAVAASSLVDDETVIAVEHHRRVAPLEAIEGFPLYRSRRHGDTVVSIYAREEAP